MAVNIFFINTITGVENMFNSLCDRIIDSEATKTHISDQSIIRSILAGGGLTKYAARRICQNIIAAEESGADIIQVTCSSVTPVIKTAATLVDIPVLSVDGPMAEEAVRNYTSIGVIATNPGTLKPSSDLLIKTAEKAGKNIKLTPVLCEGAYDALFKGDTETHDRIVIENLQKLMKKCDAVVLAQASMSRVADSLPEKENSCPLLTSPGYAIKELARQIKGLEK